VVLFLHIVSRSRSANVISFRCRWRGGDFCKALASVTALALCHYSSAVQAGAQLSLSHRRLGPLAVMVGRHAFSATLARQIGSSGEQERGPSREPRSEPSRPPLTSQIPINLASTDLLERALRASGAPEHREYVTSFD
jgi:hypothetical protein